MSGKNVCPKCGLQWKERDRSAGPPFGAIDPCLGVVLGKVNYFCCGHGGRGTIGFDNGVTIRFKSMKLTKCGPGDPPEFDFTHDETSARS